MTVDIANRLLQLRRENGFSQEDLALKLGVTRQAVSKWERAEAAPDTDNLMRLAKLYDISLDTLLLGSDAEEEFELELPPEPDQEEQEQDMPTQPYEVPHAPEPARRAAPLPTSDDTLDFHIGDIHIRLNRNAFPYPLLVTAVYLLIGFLFRWWHPGWLLYLTIPLYYTMPNLRHTPDRRAALRKFPYPVLVTLAFLCVGFFLHLWHPGWLLYLTIPFYYILVEHVEP